MNYQVKYCIEEWMQETLITEYGHPYGDKVTLAWDQLQTYYRCCGMTDRNGERIWAESTWFRKQTKYPKNRVPLSCCATCAAVQESYCSTSTPLQSSESNSYLHTACAQIEASCASNSGNLPNKDLCVGSSAPSTVWPRHLFIHTRGCLAPFREKLEVYSAHVSSIGCVFAVLPFSCAFVAFKLLNIEHLRQGYLIAVD
ncbi:hypothetical protein Tcan_01561 [Toxocara canis]|uniref:Tetraspanin-17 n=1 Tax=Toxocara canis TaxID=6265 RepID=A0A0B2VJ54_TOXCA|nr:hypothetical protein Tcan_01561 [Toxocara canis]